MLDLGFPVDARDGDDGATALRTAAYSGNAPAVRLLLDRGADIEARDATWNSTPIEWAAVGSGEQPGNPTPDWTAAVQILLEAGASAEDIGFSPDDPKPPSPEVAALLVATANPHRTMVVVIDLAPRRSRPGEPSRLSLADERQPLYGSGWVITVAAGLTWPATSCACSRKPIPGRCWS